MTQNATIVKLLRNLGFPTHDIDGEATDFIFRFRHLGYLLMDNNNDEHFIRMAIPQVFSVTDDNKVMIYGLIERLGYRLKYVKAGISDDEVWIYYEHYVDDETEPSEDLVEHMIRSLYAAYSWFKDALDEFGEDDDDDEDDENDDDDEDDEDNEDDDLDDDDGDDEDDDDDDGDLDDEDDDEISETEE